MPVTSSPRRLIAYSALAAILGYLFANSVELSVIRVTHPTTEQLTWISDVLLAMAFGLVTYFWLHLRAARSDISRLERAQLVLDTQLSLAAEIQRGLLPAIPEQRSGWRFAARFEPAGKIGGDFYDLVDLSPTSMLILVADVSGKGIPAALSLGVVRTLFRSLAAQTQDPAVLMREVSRALYVASGGSPYATAIVLRLTLDTGQITCVNAGHPAGLVLGDGSVRLLDRGGPPAGLLPDARYESLTFDLQRDQVVLLLTDGVTEAIEGNDTLSCEVLVRSLHERLARRNVDEIGDAVMRLARESPGPAGVSDWQDDRTVVVFTGPAERRGTLATPMSGPAVRG
jgi:phosphoserine phosphatase RsbU/P